MKNYIFSRLKEASTWRGIVLLLTAAGVPISPTHADSIIAIGMAVAGAVGVFTADAKASDTADNTAQQ